MLLGDASQGSKLTVACVGEHDIDPPLLLDRLVETIEVRQFGNVSLDTGDAAADRIHGLIEFLPATARNEDMSTLLDEELRAGQTDSRGAACDNCHFALQLSHGITRVDDRVNLKSCCF